MKEVKQYQSEDGELFNSELDCINYENLISAIEGIDSRLPKLPKKDNSNFSNGEDYLQHDSEIIKKAMIDLLKISDISKEYWNEPEFLNSPFDCRFGIIGRIIGDSDSPIHSLWFRFMCMDDNYREYGQPYYALHPEKSTGICLNAGEIENLK